MKGAKQVPWLALWAFSLLPLLGWWATGLFDLDEGFYGSVIAEMNRRGEWITPYFNGHPWFEKPILTYWIGKPLFAIFGDEFGARLCSVLATLTLFAFLVWFVRRRATEIAAAWTLAIASTMLLVVALGRMLMTDAILNLAMTVALLTFWESLVGNFRWRWLSAFCLGLGVLAKGPVAIILFVPIAVWTYTREPELRPAFRSGWLIGTCILLATVATWYWPAYAANGQSFVDEFLIKQNLQRFTGGDAAHTLPLWKSFWFYIPVLLVGTAPWWWWLKSAWPTRFDREKDAALHRYLATWIVVVFAFFSLGGAKLPHYILPCAVPIALLVAFAFAKVKPDRTWRNFMPAIIGSVALCIVANGVFAWWYQRSGQSEIHALAREVRGRGRFVAFQMPRRQAELGTGKPELQETSLPSLSLVLRAPVLETESLAAVPTDGVAIVLTRKGRPVKQEPHVGFELSRVQTSAPQDHFEVWKLQPISR